MENLYVLRSPTELPTAPDRGGLAATPPTLDDHDLSWLRRHAQRREDLPRQVGAQVRHILLFVEEFRALCELKSRPQRVAEVLGAVIAAARIGFDLVAKMRIGDPHGDLLGAAEGESRCLCELELLLGALRLNGRPSEHELAHAMDPLIMLCVRFDAAATDIRSSRRRLIRGPAD